MRNRGGKGPGRALATAVLLALGLTGCAGAQAFGEGALTPLEDLNLRRQDIPVILLDAVDDPYGLRNMGRCDAIAWEVTALNDALGPDLDEPPAPEPGWTEAAGAAGALTVGLLIDVAVDFIPVRDWVRELSGAERHSREVQNAIQTGRQRRAYLKGSGLRMDCAPPAAPSWYRPRGFGTGGYGYAAYSPPPPPPPQAYIPPPWRLAR